ANTLASPKYFPASSGNTSSSSENGLIPLAILSSHDDPYIKVMQAYNATSDESPIPLPRAPIAPPIVLPPSLVLPLSLMFDPQDFFLPKEILPPPSSGNTSSSSENGLIPLAILSSHDDPYIKVMQAYNATSDESPIPLPQAPIAPPIVLPPSLVLPLSLMFDPQDFFLPKEILPPRKQAYFLSLSSTNFSA
nr:hypothetical protein [Tanacetum cinerariifolium]